MSLHSPYFFIKESEGKNTLCHNCNGGIGFMATEDLDDKTVRFIEMGIEEGKRRKAREIAECLGIKV